MNDKNNKSCFIITPIGNEGSDIFRRAKGVIDSVIKPVLEEHGFVDIKAAYEINVSGMINTQIINRIIENDLVVANLTENNPNVMYELCLRHIVAKPIIHICEKGTELPFDIKDNRTIFYENDMLGVKELRTIISGYLKGIDYNREYMDNPIYTAYKYGKLLKETKGTETHEVIDLLLEISSQISRISNSSYYQGSAYYENSNFAKIFIEGYDESHDIVDKMNNKGLEELLHIKSNAQPLRVHEIAKKLGVSNKDVIYAGSACGIKIRNYMMAIKSSDVKKIATYFQEMKEFTDQMNERHSE